MSSFRSGDLVITPGQQQFKKYQLAAKHAKSESHQQKYSFLVQLNGNIAGKRPCRIPLCGSFVIRGTVTFFQGAKLYPYWI